MPVISAEPPAMPSGFRSQSIVGADLISRSRTIAKPWSARSLPTWPESSCPRCAMSRVTSWNLSPPSSVNSMRTIAPSVWLKSLRVPSSFRSAPVISGTGFSLFSGSNRKR